MFISNLQLAEQFFFEGVDFYKNKNYENAKRSFEDALKYAPDRSSILFNYASTLFKLNFFSDAIFYCNKILTFEISHLDSLFLLSEIYYCLDDFDSSLNNINKAIAIDPDNEQFYLFRADLFVKFNKNSLAIQDLIFLINKNPNSHNSFNNLGVIYYQMELFSESLRYFEQAIKIYEDSTYLINYVKSLLKLGEINKSIEILNKVCNIDTSNSTSHFMLANAFYEKKEYHRAIEHYRHANELNSNSALILNNLALALQKINNIDESMVTFDQAILIEPNTSDFYYNKAFLCEENYFFSDAIDLYKRAIEINPISIDSFINLGNVFLKQGEFNHALTFFHKVLDIDSNNIKSNINIGYTYLELRDHINAIKYFRRAFEIDPNYPLLFGAYLHIKMLLCDWHSFSSDIEDLFHLINNKKVISTPFPILSLTDSPELQLKSANYFADYYSFKNLPIPDNIFNSHDNRKIRIGYYSSDFKNHPVAYLTTWIFESHDRNNFEIYGFSYGELVDDPIQKRIFNSFDFVYDVKDSSDFDISKLSISLSIDIAIDLSGYTQKGRPSIFNKFRCAPIQVSFLGFIGTTGSPNFDYLIADTNCITNEDLPFFTENIIRLPVSFQFNDPSRLRPDIKYSKLNYGIPADSFVFCCFNDTYKILPDIFTLWMDILKAVDKSVLWLIVDSDVARNNLIAVARSNNICVKRLIFSRRVPYTEYLLRFTVADLFLDTYPYSSGTTATDALWMNLPLITLRGNSFVSRMASSQLQLIGLDKLIAKDFNEYKNLAISLANDRVNLQKIVNCLTRYNSDFFESNSKTYLSSLELAYSKVFDIYRTKKPFPKIIDI